MAGKSFWSDFSSTTTDRHTKRKTAEYHLHSLVIPSRRDWRQDGRKIADILLSRSLFSNAARPLIHRIAVELHLAPDHLVPAGTLCGSPLSPPQSPALSQHDSSLAMVPKIYPGVKRQRSSKNTLPGQSKTGTSYHRMRAPPSLRRPGERPDHELVSIDSKTAMSGMFRWRRCIRSHRG